MAFDMTDWPEDARERVQRFETDAERLARLKRKREKLRVEAKALADQPDLTAGQRQRVENDITGLQRLDDQIDELQDRVDAAAAVAAAHGPRYLMESADGGRVTGRSAQECYAKGRLGLVRGGDPYSMEVDQLRGLEVVELRDRALRAAETRANPETLERIDVLATESPSLSARVIATASPEYSRAFFKVATLDRGELSFTEDERRAWQRAASLTDAAGGFQTPLMIDPTVHLTSDGVQANPIREIARVVNVTSDKWQSVNSAGITASFDGEAAEVSDDSITDLAATEITVHKAQAFVPFSIEIGMDWAGFEQEMRRLLADARDVLEEAKFTTGSGSGEPFGIVTALDANTNVEVAMATAGAYVIGDMYGALEAVPARFRRRASWLMSLEYLNRTRQFGTDSNYHGFTVDLTADGIPSLIGKRVYESETMDSGLTTSSVENAIVVGDFSNYVICDRAGMNVELVAHLVGSNRRPTGQRGLYAWWRVGADSINDLAFRLLQNGT